MTDIAIWLPYKELFSADGANSMCLLVRDRARQSRHREAITVYGRPVGAPFEGVRFEPIRPALAGLIGRKRGEAMRIAAAASAPNTLFETHERVDQFRLMWRRAQGRPITFHCHCDPIDDTRHLGTPALRQAVVNAAAHVYCVSDFVRRRFLADVDDPDGKVRVLHNGVAMPREPLPPKEPLIAFAGRFVPDKGVDHLAQALAEVLPQRPGWRAELVGAARFARGSTPSPFETDVAERLAPVRDRVALAGYLPHEATMAVLTRAAIVAVPSIWEEAFGLVAAEALARGCAVVAYARGGLPEVVGERGLLVEPEATALARALAQLIDDADLRGRLQTATRDTGFPFTIEATTAIHDRFRDALVSSTS